MNAHAEVRSTSVLDEIAAKLAAIDFEGAAAPEQGVKKCSHFVAFGQPNDTIKRYLLYIHGLNEELRTFIRSSSKSILINQVEHIFSDNVDAKQTARAAAESALKVMRDGARVRKRHIQLAKSLLQEEIVLQFPEADDAAIDHVFVDEDWTIGWLDHRNAGEEFLERIKSFMRETDDGQGSLFTDEGDTASASDPQHGAADLAIGIMPDGSVKIISDNLGDVPPEIADQIRTQALQQAKRMSERLGRGGFDLSALLAELSRHRPRQ